MQGPGLATNLSEIPPIKGLDNLRVGVRDSRPAIFAVPFFLKELRGHWRACLIISTFPISSRLPTRVKRTVRRTKEGQKNRRERGRGPDELNTLL